jgi:hypothetical protein
MIKFTREWSPGHREYYLVLFRNGSRNDDGRCDYYDGCFYSSREAAQKKADQFNNRRRALNRDNNTPVASAVVVASKRLPGQWVTTGALPLS